jgi:hypothetical protein
MDWRGEGASIQLPGLTGKEAWVVVAILERIEKAIWQAHGLAMADYQNLTFPDLPVHPCSFEKETGHWARNKVPF